ncbi:MAG: integrase core domain-containing protein [Gammaproteobacteria bacterium]|nr:integrase core domain-containing protein [Gammaproteobacteria bacterium]
MERLDRTYRDQPLDEHLFAGLDYAREATCRWTIAFDRERPRNSLGDCTPAEARRQAENAASPLSS